MVRRVSRTGTRYPLICERGGAPNRDETTALKRRHTHRLGSSRWTRTSASPPVEMPGGAVRPDLGGNTCQKNSGGMRHARSSELGCRRWRPHRNRRPSRTLQNEETVSGSLWYWQSDVRRKRAGKTRGENDSQRKGREVAGSIPAH